jgi:signal peptidase I
MNAGATAKGQGQGLVWRQICFGTNPSRTLVRVSVWAIATTLFFHRLLLPIQIVGSSMAPTYSTGSMNFINKLSYVGHEPTRGDIIALSTTDELLLKRIVGLPGEQVSITRGHIQINGKPLEDKFSKIRIPWETKPIRLRNDEFYVIGDNRENSVFGPVTREQILGKIVF